MTNESNLFYLYRHLYKKLIKLPGARHRYLAPGTANRYNAAINLNSVWMSQGTQLCIKFLLLV